MQASTTLEFAQISLTRPVFLNVTTSVSRVEQPLINCLLMTKHSFILSSYVLHFEWFKMLWYKGSNVNWPIINNLSMTKYQNIISNIRNHPWSVNEKEQWKKKNKKNNPPSLQIFVFSFFFSRTCLTFKLHKFLISYIFWTIHNVIKSNLCCYRNITFLLLIYFEQFTML